MIATEFPGPPFELFPEAQRWWSFADYGAVVGLMRRFGAREVLEFGPGSSTLALLEGGASRVDTFEDNPDWLGVWAERLAARFPDRVFLHPFEWADPLELGDAFDRRKWDLALIDGPHGTLARPAVIAWALARCKVVVVPTEEIAYGRGALRLFLEALAETAGVPIEYVETGPAAGGFAVLARRRPGRPWKVKP